MTLGAERLARTRRVLVLAFGAAAAVFAITDLVVSLQRRAVQRETHAVVDNMLVSIELVGRIARDIDRHRLLLDAHIFENEKSPMLRVEAELREVDADLATTLRSYEPLAILPGERSTLELLKDDVAAVDGPSSEALKLSRQNRDDEARAALVQLEPRFEHIEAEARQLIQINRANAERTLARIRSTQHAANLELTAVGVGAILFTLIVGGWTTHLIGEWERQMGEHAEALETRNRELDAFAGRVAHDLRGPLTAVGLVAGSLCRTRARPAGARDEDRAKIGERLQRAVERMEGLIDDLLELSRVEVQAVGDGCDPKRVAAQVADELTPRLREEGAALHLAMESARIKCGEGLLRQTLVNLADNALKYRRPEVPAIVEIVGRATQGGYALRVSDNGSGMSHEDASRAFEPFYRAERAQSAPGTGLGLSIVKRVIEINGGTIAVESELDRGTTFLIELPLLDPAA